MVNYFFSVPTGFGPRGWIGLLIWLAALGAGAYLYSMWQERNPVRARFVRQLGLGLSVVGAIGVLLLALKAFRLPIVSYPAWSYLWALVTVAYLAWAGWFYLNRLPRLLAASARPARGTAHGARTYTTNGSRSAQPRPPTPPRPVATTGRREARRDKKRKGR